MAVSQRIKELIKIKELSTVYIAKSINASEGTVRNFKSGRNAPSLDFLLFLKKEYSNLNLNWLLAGEGEMWLSEGGATVGKSKDEVEKKVDEQGAKIKALTDKVDELLLRFEK